MTDTPLCFIDTETDGVHPDRNVWEFAMTRRYTTGGTTFNTSFTAFVEIDLATADPFGLKVGGFYDRHPFGRHLSDLHRDHTSSRQNTEPVPGRPLDGENYLTRREAAITVARMTHGAHLVGVVPSFDAEVLAALLRAHGLTPAWHYHLVDVEAMAAGHLHQGPPWSSDELSRRCGVGPPDETDRHTAMGDTEWAMRWYDALLAAA